MSDASAEQRMIENEVVFRNRNERLRQNLADLKQMAAEDGQESFMADMDDRLAFYCECSDENCQKRLNISPDRFQEAHKRRNRFVVLPGHQVPQIEHIIVREPEYLVVEKYKLPNRLVSKLKRTEVDNT